MVSVATMMSRSESLEVAADQVFDVCVIGGGATGAGCALDAQLRGLKTILIEAGDFGCATSSASTKLVHGGVRYLRQAVTHLDFGQFRVVKRALKERFVVLNNAPHLSHPLTLLIPCRSRREQLYFGFGMKLYDLISGRAALNPSRLLSLSTTLSRMPMLEPDKTGLVGSVTFADGQFNDARYNIAIVQSFREAGGIAFNYARVTGFDKSSSGHHSAKVEDLQTGDPFEIRARAFVNATGPFSDTVRRMANPKLAPRLRLSKGVHILFPLELFEGRDALMIPHTEDGRLLFAIPWQGRLLVGTTETEADLGEEMIVLRSEAEYILRQINPYLRSPLELDQIVSGFAGLRPLVSTGTSRDTRKLIRDHEVEVDAESGLVSILGGKWTTYRAMAEDTIDHVQRALGSPISKSQTLSHRLPGSEGYSEDYWNTLAGEFGLCETAARHLASKYGARAGTIAVLCRESKDLMQPILEGLPWLKAEVVHGIREEMAQTIEDVLARRLGMQFFGWREAIRAAPITGELLGQELGWSRVEIDQAVEDYVGKLNSMLGTIGQSPEPMPARIETGVN